MKNLVVSKKKNPLFMGGWIERIRPSRSPFVIIWQASWCQSVILATGFSIQPTHSWWILHIYRLMIRCATPPPPTPPSKKKKKNDPFGFIFCFLVLISHINVISFFNVSYYLIPWLILILRFLFCFNISFPALFLNYILDFIYRIMFETSTFILIFFP